MSISRRRFITTGTMTLAGASILNLDTFAGITADKPVRMAMIGYGHRGAGVMNLISDNKNIDVVAICDIDEERLKLARSKYGGKKVDFYTQYSDVLKNKQVEAVIIATPITLHYPMSVDGLAANKHVYVEKTMTYNIYEALKLTEIVRKSDRVFQVGHQYRYYDMYHEIKKAIDEGYLGEISHIESQYNRNSDWRRSVGPGESEKVVNWRLYKEFSGGLLAELSGHQIDIVNWFVGGHPNKVTGFGGINYWKDGRDIYDNIKVIFEYDNGVKSEVTAVSSNQHKGYFMKILGSKGTVEISRDSARFFPEPKTKKLGTVDGVTGATLDAIPAEGIEIKYGSPDNKKKEPTAYALADFAVCIRKGKKPFCDIEAGKNVAISVHMANAAMDREHVQYWKKEYNI